MKLEGLEPAEPIRLAEPVQPSQPEQLWELKVTATGFVSDADGNVISGDVPVDFQTITVTESQARQLLEGNDSQ